MNAKASAVSLNGARTAPRAGMVADGRGGSSDRLGAGLAARPMSRQGSQGALRGRGAACYSASAQLSSLQLQQGECLTASHSTHSSTNYNPSSGLKRRKMDPTKDGSAEALGDDLTSAQCMVYIHPVSGGDTFPSIMLKYSISAPAILKANRMWAQDNIHSRSRLFLPIQECGVMARRVHPEDPSLDAQHREEDGMRREEGHVLVHHKWVDIPNVGRVEVGMIPLHTLTYFPPGKRKAAVDETPRESFESTGSVGTYLEDVFNSGINKAFEAARRRFKGIGEWTNDLIEL